MIGPTLDPGRAADRPWDALVIGAGPAGALAARELAASGMRVLLVDRKAFPRPKVCGACLNGKALAVLRSVGLAERVERLGGIDLGRFEVRLAGRAARFPLPAGKALARDVLDAALVEEAIAAGAAFLPAASATLLPGGERARLVRLDGQGRGVTVESRVVIAAAGLSASCLGDEPGICTRVAPDARVGAGCVLRSYPESYERGTIHMAVGRSGYVGLVRLPDGSLNVAAAFDRDFVRARGGPAGASAEVLDEAGFPAPPGLAEASWRGTAGLTRRARPAAGRRLFLIGDAAGYVEPFTGEGIGAALLSARLVAPLARRGASCWGPSLASDWARLHGRRIARQQAVIRGIAFAARHAPVARCIFGLAARSPSFSGALIRRVNGPPLLLEGRS